MAQRASWGAGVRRGTRDHRGHDDVVPPAPARPRPRTALRAARFAICNGSRGAGGRFKSAQPALLYLVPGALGAALLTAAARGEISVYPAPESLKP